MLFGEQPCDGRIEAPRCVACALRAQDVAVPLARLAAAVPTALAQAVAGWPVETKPLLKLRIPGLLAGGKPRFDRFVGKADHIVAVCQWVRDVLRRNGVPDDKITLSRQGIDGAMTPAERAPPDGYGPLKIAYFGRIDRRRPTCSRVPFLWCRRRMSTSPSMAFANPDLRARLAGSIGRRDSTRLRILPAVAAREVMTVMTCFDLVAIPSRWLETGPLVALEAFAARVPVLGAYRGGIAEVVRDGIDGMLVEADDPAAWAAAIDRLAADRGLVRKLRAGIAPPRTVNAAADDMAGLYSRIAPAQ